jgi:predicted ester cyclase
MSTDPLATVRQFYALLNGEENGLELWKNTVAETWRASPPFPETPTQIEGYQQAAVVFRRGFPDLNFSAEEIIANQQGFVAVRSTVTGTHLGELMGVAATGKSVTFIALDIHKIENGKIQETWHVEDFAFMMKQLKS